MQKCIIFHHIQNCNLIRLNEIIGHLRSCVFTISIPGIKQVQLNCHFTLLSKRHISGRKQTYKITSNQLLFSEFSAKIDRIFLPNTHCTPLLFFKVPFAGASYIENKNG